jgi:hypothetical protein
MVVLPVLYVNNNDSKVTRDQSVHEPLYYSRPSELEILKCIHVRHSLTIAVCIWVKYSVILREVATYTT